MVSCCSLGSTATDAATINPADNSITGTSRQCANEECLHSSVEASSLSPYCDVVLNEAEDEQDYECYSDRYEQGVGNVGHCEVGNHRNKTTFQPVSQATAASRRGCRRRLTNEIRQSHRCS